MPRRDIDSGWAWLVLLASYFNLLVCSGLAYVAGMFQLVFLEQFQGSVSFTSWVTALFSSLMQLGGPLSSLLSNYFNCRVSVMTGGVFMSVGLFMSSMTNSLEMLFVTFGIVAGIGLGLTYTASIVVINYFFVEKRTLVSGVAFSASGLGLIITPQISQLLFDNFTWRESLAYMGGAAAQICVLGALMYTVHEKKKKKPNDEQFPNRRSNQECDYSSSDEDEGEEETMSMVQTDLKDIKTELSNPECDSFDFNSRHEHELVVPCPYCTEDTNCTAHYGAKCQPVPPDDTSENRRHHVGKQRSESMSHPTERPEPKCVARVEVGSLPPFPFGNLRDDINSKVNVPISGSHQELASRPSPRLGPRLKSNGTAADTQSHREFHHIPRTGSLTIATHTQSHRELSHRRLHAQRGTSSNTSLARRMGVAGSRGSFTNSQTSFDAIRHKTGDSQRHIVVISRNPSILGLVPSTSPLEIFITHDGVDAQSTASLHSNNVMENSVILTELPPLHKRANTICGSIAENAEAEAIEIEPVLSPEPQKFPPLYRNRYFWMLCLSLFVGNAGCGIFNIHLPGFMKERGLSNSEVTKVLSVNGFALLVGRCLCAFLANSVKGMDLLIYWSLSVLGGVCVLLMPPFGHSYVSMSILIFGVGSYYGSTYAVLTSITIEMVGLASLATAFGVEMVCAGLGYLVSPPLAGILVDLTNSYRNSLYCGGALFILGGMVVLSIPASGQRHNYVSLKDVIKDEKGKCIHDDSSCSLESCGLPDSEDEE